MQSPTSDVTFPSTPLAAVTIHGLFGDLNHHVTLHRTSDNLSIIHGPNGVGKTTLLRIIDSAFSRKFRQLAGLPFKMAFFEFESSAVLSVERQSQDRVESRYSLAFTGRHGSREEVYNHIFDDVYSEIPTSIIDDVVPYLHRIGPRIWQDARYGDTVTVEEAIDRYSEFLPRSVLRKITRDPLPTWLEHLISGVSTAYIRAQRLTTYDTARDRAMSRRHGREEPTVRVYSDEVQGRVSATLARYAEHSQSLDSTFPPRVLDRDTAVPDAAALRERYNEQALRRSDYVAAGLLDGTEAFDLPDREFEGGERRMLATWFDDIDEKLSELEETAAKLSLLKEIVNSKFRRKTLSVSRHEGFVVTNTAGQPLPLTELSSGEQQELVLAHELLFRHDPGTLVLIDEPELSLHVSWQMAFIPDLLRVSKLSNLQFLVATHSPQIIGDRWDLTSELSDDVSE